MKLSFSGSKRWTRKGKLRKEPQRHGGGSVIWFIVSGKDDVDQEIGVLQLCGILFCFVCARMQEVSYCFEICIRRGKSVLQDIFVLYPANVFTKKRL